MTQQDTLSKSEILEKKHHWFLIRGLAREIGHWGDFSQLFEKAFPMAKVTYLELPGAGIYRDVAPPLSVQEITRFVRHDFLKARQENPDSGPAFVLSISLGGMVTMDWLNQFPDDFKGAVLINSSVKSYSSMFKRMQPAALSKLVQASFTADLESREAGFLNVVANSDERRKQALPNWIRIQKDRPVALKNAIRQLLAAARFNPPKPARLPPVMIVNSLGDRLAHPSCSEALAKNWGTDLKTHPWGGHDLSIDDPQWIIDQIKGWRI